MMQPAQTSRPARSAAPAAISPKVDFGSLISKAGKGLPNRYILYAGEKWGKTSFAAQFPGVIFIQARGETGLETLIDAGQLPPVPHFPEAQNWSEVLAQVDWLRSAEHGYKALALDTINMIERLMHEQVCARDYNGDWGDRGFGAYQKGYDVAVADLVTLLSALDSLRVERRMTIIMLAHRRILTIKNPAGADYDSYQPDVHKTTWGALAKWSDIILYGDNETVVGQVQENKRTGAQKGKGISQTRILRARGTAAWVAGNRLGLPDEIEVGDSPVEAFRNFADALKAARLMNQTESEVANG